jgi:hypothetical protein
MKITLFGKFAKKRLFLTYTLRFIHIKRKVELFAKNQNLDFKPLLKIAYNQKILDFCVNHSYYIYVK